MVDMSRIVAGVASAIVVGLFGGAPLVAVLCSEPPPTRRKAVKAVLETVTAMLLGGVIGVLAAPFAAGFVNGLVEKFTGVSPGVDPIVAGVLVAVLVTGIGPALIAKAERLVGRKLDEVVG